MTVQLTSSLLRWEVIQSFQGARFLDDSFIFKDITVIRKSTKPSFVPEMLVIFRYREDASSFSQQVFELCETKLNCYKIQFVEQQAQSTNLSQTMLEIFKKYSQKYTSGKNFFYVNITSDFDSNVISDLLTNFYHNRFCSITEAVTELWDSCHSWGNCFDLINSFLSSKTVAVIKCHFDDYLINFPHNYLCEASDHESDFSIDGGLWSITIVTFPLIQLAQAASTFEPLITAGQGMTTAACHVNQESEEDWEIITTSEEFDSLSLERIEMSEISDEPSTQLENNAHSEKTTTSTSSYRDVLLKPSLAPTTTVRDFPKTVQQKSTWKPVLIVTKTPYLRSDRVYGRQQEEYEDDGNGCWDLVDAHAMLKYDTALSRKRGIVMVTPKAQEKKDQKMIAKAKG